MVTYLIILPTIADKLYNKHTNTNNKPVKQSFDKGIDENCPNKPRSGRNFMKKQLAWWTSLNIANPTIKEPYRAIRSCIGKSRKFKTP